MNLQAVATKKLKANKVAFDPTLLLTIITAIANLSKICPFTPTPDPQSGIQLNLLQKIALNSELKKQAKADGIPFLPNKKALNTQALALLATLTDANEIKALHASI